MIGVFASTKDLVAVTRRFDKDQNGKVTYTEFIDEMTPKSPTKYWFK